MPKDKKGKPKNYKYYKGSIVVGKKADGTPERLYVRGKSKQERDDRLAEVKRLYARGLKQGEMTVREWSERWTTVYKANASETQKAHYNAKLKHDILPVVGSLRMKDVRASHLQEILNKYKGGKKGTVEKIRHAIRQLFEDAEVEGIIERNPATRLELPDLEEDPRRPLTLIERQTILKVAEAHPRGPYVLVMLYCGLRRGECAALDRSSIDLDRKRLTVNKALSLRKNVGEVTGTKSAKMRKSKVKNNEDIGVRITPIPDMLLPILTALCDGKEEGDILFPKSDGKHATKQTLSWWWASFVRQCHIEGGAKLYRNAIQYETSPFGVEVTPHYLRHTYATDLYAAGVDEKARKEFLGHASNDVTDIYTAMSDESFERATVLVNEYYVRAKWKANLDEPQQALPKSAAVNTATLEYDAPDDLFRKLGI